jgi:hypothetical protein
MNGTILLVPAGHKANARHIQLCLPAVSLMSLRAVMAQQDTHIGFE